QAALVVHRVAPAVAHSGDTVRVYAGGYLGPQPWPAHPIVLVPLAQAPKAGPCGGGWCPPTTTPAALHRPPFVPLGSIARWRPAYYGGEGVLTARLPVLAPGRYAVLLFCEQCGGSLIGDARIVLRVR